jgi:hypothetical protein
VCGAPLRIPLTGRRPRYCGKPCRQAAYRARLAADRAAALAAGLRRELAGSGSPDVHLGVEHMIGLVSRDVQRAALRARFDEETGLGTGVVPFGTGWEDEVADRARTLVTLARRAMDLATAHARAVADWQAAQAVFRRVGLPGPGGDETLQSSVSPRAAGDRATKHGAPAGVDRDAVFDAIEDVVYALDPTHGHEIPARLDNAAAGLAEAFARQDGAGPLGELAAAAAVLDAAHGCAGLPAAVTQALDTLAAVLPALAAA